jgi:hypothetical protein
VAFSQSIPNTIANPTRKNRVNKKVMADTTMSVLNVISACPVFIVLAVRVGNRPTDILLFALVFSEKERRSPSVFAVA